MEQFIEINDLNEWDAFWNENRDALECEVEDSARNAGLSPEELCFHLAANCSLFIGGGATPLFRVGFVD